MTKNEKRVSTIIGDIGKVIPITLVNRALEELTARASVNAEKNQKIKVKPLVSELISKDGNAHLMVDFFLNRGITIEDIFETYIPESARLLGDLWLENCMSFADVTIATSRLQELARKLEHSYIGGCQSSIVNPEILIVVPKGESHTLGAQMLTRKFRRIGANPYLAVGFDLEDLTKIIKSRRFELLGISISNSITARNKDNVIATIECLKTSKIPLAQGGSLIKSDALAKFCIPEVDLVTNDPIHALKHFEIKTSNYRKFKSQRVN